MKIAYVEDDVDGRTTFGNRLRADGHLCQFYGCAEELLETALPGDFDVIIADIRLPKMTGVELIAKLRERNILTPCILITAFNSLEYARGALNANANFLLEKPFNYQALVSAIRQVTSASLTVQHCVERGLVRLNLTNRELEVARLVLKGLSNSDIARISGLSEKTVKQYITQIFQKADVSSRGEFFSSIFPV